MKCGRKLYDIKSVWLEVRIFLRIKDSRRAMQMRVFFFFGICLYPGLSLVVGSDLITPLPKQERRSFHLSSLSSALYVL